jgi:hypothetical protein
MKQLLRLLVGTLVAACVVSLYLMVLTRGAFLPWLR